MAILDARDFDDGAEIASDICVVGGGAAGITLARELARTGREVLLIESGGCSLDETTQRLYDLASVGYPQRPGFISRVRFLGGSCNLWGGACLPLDPLDFTVREWVQHSGWPISYSEVATWYPRAAEILSLPAPDPSDPPASGRKFFSEAIFDPKIALFASSAERFGDSFAGFAHDVSRLRLLLNASVVRITLNEAADAVESLDIATLDGDTRGNRLRVTARTVVLACGGLENARLLLASDRQQPKGIGNRYGLVGRFFMDHPRTQLGKVHLTQGKRFPRTRVLANGLLEVRIGLSPEIQRRDSLLNHTLTFETLKQRTLRADYPAVMEAWYRAALQGDPQSTAGDTGHPKKLSHYLRPRRLLPDSAYPFYANARVAARQLGPASRVVVYTCEQPPDHSSRVTLGSERDVLGMRRLQLDWRIAPAVSESVLRIQTLLGEYLQRQGLGHLEPEEGEISYTDASHHMGTTRMSADPRSGVVDPNCRVHGVENLYIAGSSVFPCGGSANPTLTIIALTLRLAGHLARR